MLKRKLDQLIFLTFHRQKSFRALPVFQRAATSIKTNGIPLVSLAIGLRFAHKLPVAYCEAPLPQPAIKISITQAKVLHEISLPQKKSAQSILADIWQLVKPDLGLLCLIILTAVGAAVIQLQTPLVTGQLINILSQSVQAAADGLGALTIRDLNAPAIKLFGLLIAQGEKCSFF